MIRGRFVGEQLDNGDNSEARQSAGGTKEHDKQIFQGYELPVPDATWGIFIGRDN
jgi:hypothetical protein